jgi:hypothetical protein
LICWGDFYISVGVYKLVEPTGVDYLRQCPLDGAFHPHDIDDRLLYTVRPPFPFLPSLLFFGWLSFFFFSFFGWSLDALEQRIRLCCR